MDKSEQQLFPLLAKVNNPNASFVAIFNWKTEPKT